VKDRAIVSSGVLGDEPFWRAAAMLELSGLWRRESGG